MCISPQILDESAAKSACIIISHPHGWYYNSLHIVHMQIQTENLQHFQYVCIYPKAQDENHAFLIFTRCVPLCYLLHQDIALIVSHVRSHVVVCLLLCHIRKESSFSLGLIDINKWQPR